MERLFDPDMIRRTIKIMKPDSELFEVRIIRGKDILSAYFRDAETLIRKLSEQNLDGKSVYLTLQRIHEGCEARRQWENFIDVGRQKLPSTSDNDITAYSFIPIDLDPERPAEISSTEEELEAARELSYQIIAYMTDNGFKKYIKALSGNGYHLLFPVDIPTRTKAERDAGKERVSEILATLDQYFSNDACHVDTTLSNPARILKLYGTLAQKGRNTPQRPFRMSKILEVVGFEKD